MEQDNPNQPKDNKKKIVKKVVKKVSTTNSAGQTSQVSPAKKVVRRVVVKKNVQPEVNGVSQKPLQNTSKSQEVKSEAGKINYWEEIEKLAPSNKNENHSILDSDNTQQQSQAENTNKVIKGAAPSTPTNDGENTVNVGKKVLRKKSKFKKIFKKYGIMLIVFFVFSLSYLSWTYLVPGILNFKITHSDINDFLQPKIGYKVDFASSNFYTTPKLGIGVRFKNLKLVYLDGRIDDDSKLFLKAKSAIFEVPVIPLLMKTIKFNEFSLRSVNANLYRDNNGKYAYLEQFKVHFNPNLKKYILEVPDIEIISYNMPSFNAQTGVYTKDRGAKMTIQAKTIKEILKEFPNSSTVMIR